MKHYSQKQKHFSLVSIWGVALLALLVCQPFAYAQNSTLVTSGMGGGASSTAKLSAQVAQLQARLNAIEACGAKSMLYGGTAFGGTTDGDDCTIGMNVDTSNDLFAPNNLRVGDTSAPTSELHVTGDVLVEPASGSSVLVELGSGTDQAVVRSPSQLVLSSVDEWIRLTGSTTSGHTLLVGSIGAGGLRHTFGTPNTLAIGVGSGFASPTTTNYETLVITSDDQIGVGTETPGEKLDVVGNVRATAYFYTSDRSLKQGIRPIQGGLNIVEHLRPVTFNWKKDGTPSPGFIAQEVEDVLPDVVATDSRGIKSVDYAKIVAPLVAAVQEQQVQIKALQAQVKQLQQK